MVDDREDSLGSVNDWGIYQADERANGQADKLLADMPIREHLSSYRYGRDGRREQAYLGLDVDGERGTADSKAHGSGSQRTGEVDELLLFDSHAGQRSGLKSIGSIEVSKGASSFFV